MLLVLLQLMVFACLFNCLLLKLL